MKPKRKNDTITHSYKIDLYSIFHNSVQRALSLPLRFVNSAISKEKKLESFPDDTDAYKAITVLHYLTSQTYIYIIVICLI